tara:strand:- start:4379 stop:4810 length:432 start_codon:yes stop_codon:yes gene_type:complete
MSDYNFLKEFNEAKKQTILECCKYFSHKYELDEHYKNYSLEEDYDILEGNLINSNLSKGGKRKKDKDPNKPKKPLSAYMFFTQDYRDVVKKENPEATLGQISKMLGGIWSELESDDKLPFEQKAKDAKIEYKKSIENYNNNLK